MREYINLYDIYRKHKRSEIDYVRLISFLSQLRHPRQKVTQWIQEGLLIRIKKGLYVFGSKITEELYSKEIIASMIYGPSALSMDYALSYYGLIPERVDHMTSITPKRDKVFITPIGTFSYRYLSPTLYPLGLKLVQSHGSSYLIASPEKAILDKLTLQAPIFKKKRDLELYLRESLRIDWKLFKRLDLAEMKELGRSYHKKNVKIFIQLLEENR